MTYYSDKLLEGQKFETHVAELFFNKFAINLDFTSKEDQIKIGETLQGIEIKFDDKYNETGNLYIEVAEKTNADNKEYVRSGIFRDDNTWLYVIGNYEIIYMFSKKHLQRLKSSCHPVVTLTSMGFLIPKELAEEESILILRP